MFHSLRCEGVLHQKQTVHVTMLLGKHQTHLPYLREKELGHISLHNSLS